MINNDLQLFYNSASMTENLRNAIDVALASEELEFT